jgi:hypothetical protein
MIARSFCRISTSCCVFRSRTTTSNAANRFAKRREINPLVYQKISRRRVILKTIIDHPGTPKQRAIAAPAMFGPRSISTRAIRVALPSSRISQNPFSAPSVPKAIPRQKRCYRASFPRRQEKHSFQGQLYESTQQRLNRERAEVDRYAEMQKESPSLRYTALTVCMQYSHSLFSPMRSRLMGCVF